VSEFLIHLATLAGIYALMSLGLSVQAGMSGLLNFGHIAFAGIGAYAAAIAAQAGWPAAAGIAAGMAGAALLGLAMARLGRQLGADYWGIATLALAEIVRLAATNEGWLTGGAQGISPVDSALAGLPGVWDSAGFLLCSAAGVAAGLCLARRIGGGRLGRALRLMREEPQLAACLGYDLTALKTRAMVLGACMTACGGALLAYYTRFVGPDYLTAAETFLIWTMVVVGGLGSHAGAVLGALLVQAIHAAVPFLRDALGAGSDVAGALRLGLVGLLLLACLLWRPQGLLPEKPGRVR